MLTISQQNEILKGISNETKRLYGIAWPGHPNHEFIKREGYVYYPELCRITVDDCVDVWWDSGKDDLQDVNLNNPEHLERLLGEARRKINTPLHLIITPNKLIGKPPVVTKLYKEPDKMFKEVPTYEKLSFDGSFIYYRPGNYDPVKDLALLKAIYVAVKYSEIQVFPWVGCNPDEWEVTWT